MNLNSRVPSSKFVSEGDLLMKHTFSATLLTGALLCAAAIAQGTPAQTPGAPPQQPETQPQAQQPAQPNQAPASTPTGNQEQTAATPRIAPGSVIPVQLTKTIDAKKAKPGDEVVTKVTMDMKSNSGEVIVPKDTKVVGHVTEAQTRSKDQKESQVGIAFDRAMLKGSEVSLPMSIQAVIAPPSNNANSSGGAPDQGAPPSGGNSTPSPMAGGRSGSASGQTQPSSPTPNAMPPQSANDSQQGNARPPITGNTQGVVGISNLKLEPAPSAAQGSVLSSEKNNVKVESGTMMLLKVNP
jgi:hypothetical protein